MGCKQNSANITTTLAAGSVASPYAIMARIEQTLCAPVSVDNLPIFAPTFSVLSFSEVSTDQYVAIVQVEGVIFYSPCGGNIYAARPLPIKHTLAKFGNECIAGCFQFLLAVSLKSYFMACFGC